jgi:selenium metabolism protein YedF
VVLFASDSIGRGDDELGGILARAILYSFTEVEPKPHTIIFMNSGVKLVVEGSEVLEDLDKLAQAGVQVMACGTCLDFFGLKEKIKVGEISNAYTIAEALLEAGKVVRF